MHTHRDDDPEHFRHRARRWGKRFFAHGRRGGPFGGGPFGERGGRRQRRGDIRYILLELINEQPRHGYELIKALEERSSGFYRPSPGSVYPTLQLLEEEGSLTSQMVNDKRVYTITEAGKKVLTEESEHNREERAWGDRGRHGMSATLPELMELRRHSMEILETVMQVGRYGTPEQIKEVEDLLTKTSQAIHAILAQDHKPKRV